MKASSSKTSVIKKTALKGTAKNTKLDIEMLTPEYLEKNRNSAYEYLIK